MGLVSPRRLAVRTLQSLGLAKPVSDIYYRYFHGFSSATPELGDGLVHVFEAASDLGSLRDGGDYCEFGVFKGYSFWKAQQEANRHDLTCRFFGFDSFTWAGPNRRYRSNKPWRVSSRPIHLLTATGDRQLERGGRYRLAAYLSHPWILRGIADSGVSREASASGRSASP